MCWAEAAFRLPGAVKINKKKFRVWTEGRRFRCDGPSITLGRHWKSHERALMTNALLTTQESDSDEAMIFYFPTGFRRKLETFTPVHLLDLLGGWGAGPRGSTAQKIRGLLNHGRPWDPLASAQLDCL